MSKTILITGSSSGIGKATAKYFSSKGWNVAATMRKPEKETDLKPDDSLKFYRLDVEDESSIQQALDHAISDFNKIDVIVNNAGYGAIGPFEAASMSQIKRQFDVNVFGLMAVTQNILPHFRKNRAGTIINISSIGGRTTFPMLSLYTGTKWAVEGFSESLAYELEQFGIKVKIIEPGGVKTDFMGRSLDPLKKEGLTDYQDYQKKFDHVVSKGMEKASEPELTAQVIYKAANDPSNRLRYLAGKDAKMIWKIRRIFGDSAQIKIVKTYLK